MGVRVLLIEDDRTIAEPLIEGLGNFGLTVHHVSTGNEGLRGPYGDVVLLDLGLPDIDGIDVCRGIRQTSDVPIIILSARGEEADRVLGLELGADDYLAKPFSMRELVARVRAVTRRTQRGLSEREFGGAAPYYDPAPPTPVASAPAPVPAPAPAPASSGAAGPLVVDRRTRQVWVGPETVTLTPKEFELLALLTEDPGAVYSRQQILDRVWDPHYQGPTKTLDVHVATLRRKLGNPAWIQTLRGVGFRLAVHTTSPGPPPQSPAPPVYETTPSPYETTPSPYEPSPSPSSYEPPRSYPQQTHDFTQDHDFTRSHQFGQTRDFDQTHNFDQPHHTAAYR
ncbi:DNA-binding response regulator, OmpR family, contains REC and winged-helix (wHTH) domain [Streptomyces sp. yr375]|uniref:response regulator transcription factor n=1 Tax=Streptomyces sp. yr375 TaxID=1761906 RepID=UPI0008C2962A|nr:DNA-binding response regulator, OmpR family, contains REC and winged-helix (wHTH) domain [Streptomyces sp. yr375]